MQITQKAIAAAALAVLGSSPAFAQADGYPARPITIVIGSTAGSATDGLTRAVGAEITKATGQPVVVESRAGAFGGIAAQYVAQAKPDGYTFFMTTNTTQSANPHLLKKIAYDPIKDFSPVALLARGHLMLVTNPSVKAQNVAELVALAILQQQRRSASAARLRQTIAQRASQRLDGGYAYLESHHSLEVAQKVMRGALGIG